MTGGVSGEIDGNANPIGMDAVRHLLISHTGDRTSRIDGLLHEGSR